MNENQIKKIRDKRDKEIGTEDNPLPLISFKDRSKKNPANNTN